MNGFDWLLAAISAAGGFVGSISGFGIASLITPVLAGRAGTKLAVALVSVPHAIGTAVRFWPLRHKVTAGSRRVRVRALTEGIRWNGDRRCALRRYRSRARLPGD